ncbi:hypothetical protein SEVIR_6G200400v4 [Setaria viridis]|uniref:Uncharacterized protein n=1 Tax=Setaria viridis TaxID=4556 RepID=A0A4U6U5I0_SETVI|nr:hypothetical protein SEVIR_6G200400v2 [Setaria viridis]
MEAATSGQRAGSSSSTAPTYNGRLDAVTLVVSSMAPSSSTSLEDVNFEISWWWKSGWNSITSQNCQKVNSEGCFVGCLRGFCSLSSWIQAYLPHVIISLML